MLTVKPVEMFLLGQTWYQVVDAAGCSLGALGTQDSAERYKSRLEENGVNSAEDLLALIPAGEQRDGSRSLMQPEPAV